MSAIKRVLSHGWFIVLIVLLVVGFYYRHQLFPSLFEAPQTGVSETPRTATTEDRQPSPAAQPPAQQTPVARARSGATDERISVRSTPAPAETPPEVPETPTPRMTESETPLAHETGGAMQSASPETQAPPASADGRARSPAQVGMNSTQGMTLEQALDSARSAYWAGDYPTAIGLYTRLLEQQPENIDWHGELGNIYYAQGQWKAAGEAYYQAARRLAKSGNIARALDLRRIIRGLNPEKAEALKDDLREANRRYR